MPHDEPVDPLADPPTGSSASPADPPTGSSAGTPGASSPESLDRAAEAARAAVQRGNARLGLVLFAIYLVLYAGFVLVSAFFTDSLDWRPAGGLNLALLWGFALIVAAIVLALVYGRLAKTEAEVER